MLVTLLGIVTLFRPKHLSNDIWPMAVTPSRITAFEKFSFEKSLGRS